MYRIQRACRDGLARPQATRGTEGLLRSLSSVRLSCFTIFLAFALIPCCPSAFPARNLRPSGGHLLANAWDCSLPTLTASTFNRSKGGHGFRFSSRFRIEQGFHSESLSAPRVSETFRMTKAPHPFHEHFR